MSGTRTLEATPRLVALFESPGAIETPTPGVKVWLARDPELNRPVLVKRLPLAMSKSRVTEALSLSHENIVKVRRWMQDTDGLYVVRDVARGKNLRQFLAANGSRPDIDMLQQLFTPVIDALTYAHQMGTAHGGISMENILIGDDKRVTLTDFGTTDPGAPQHKSQYDGIPIQEGDIRAAARLLATLLPSSGAFAAPVVRSRIEGICLRCNTLSDLRDTLQALDRLASAPLPRATPVIPPIPKDPPGMVFAPSPNQVAPAMVDPNAPLPTKGIPKLSCSQPQRSIIPAGGGGLIAVDIKNDGDATLIVRMVAGQHAWINLRPTALPLVLAPGATGRIALVVSGARLAPGDYRSDIYLSTNAPGRDAEDLRTGWYRHTFEVRVSIGHGGGAAASGWR